MGLGKCPDTGNFETEFEITRPERLKTCSNLEMRCRHEETTAIIRDLLSVWYPKKVLENLGKMPDVKLETVVVVCCGLLKR